MTVSRPERVDGGGQVSDHLGANPLPHERLFLQPVSPPLALPDRIDGSPDGVAWQPLTPVAGIPGEPEGDSGWIPFSYPVTGDRYLRCHWPGLAKPPGIAAAEVEAVTGPTLSETFRDTECDTSQPGRAFCTLTLPAAGQTVRRLTVEVAGGGRTGYRLEAPRDSRWQTLAEGVWHRGEGPAQSLRHLIPGGPEPVADSVLRLEPPWLGPGPATARELGR